MAITRVWRNELWSSGFVVLAVEVCILMVQLAQMFNTVLLTAN